MVAINKNTATKKGGDDDIMRGILKTENKSSPTKVVSKRGAKSSRCVGVYIIIVLLLCSVTLAVGFWLKSERQLKETSGAVRKGKSTCCINTGSQDGQPMKQMLNKPESKPEGFEDLEFLISAGRPIVFAALTGAVMIVVCVLCYLKKKKIHCFKDNGKQGNYKATATPLTNNTLGEVQSHSSEENDKGLDHENETVGEPHNHDNESERKPPKDGNESAVQSHPPQTHEASSSKPAWLNVINRILINNVHQLDVLVEQLGTKKFNATAKWSQLDDRNNETRFIKLMNLWYEKTQHPSVTTIIQALKDIQNNAIINLIKKDDILNKQLKEECSAFPMVDLGLNISE